ncbi:FecR domain-containing protein [Oxalobacteraceae bacterium]|nr:FecR domain-containing protein [Oxalobacteraceae bacterium]
MPKSRRGRKGAAVAVSLLAILLLCGGGKEVWAAPVAGTVVQLSGAISASGPGGAPRALQLKSEVEEGDTLVTAGGSFARISFLDRSELTLKPGTTVKIDAFGFDDARAEGDRAVLTLVKGGLRSVTGLLGKRSKEKFTLKTPSATIGIRGTSFILEFITDPHMLAASPGLPPGLHVFVKDGGLSLSNQAGLFLYDAGQFGYFKDDKTKPVKMTENPGMRFDLPAEFGEAGGVW